MTRPPVSRQAEAAARMVAIAPRLVANELDFRIHFLTQDSSPRAWARSRGLNYPTVHKILTGANKASRPNGVGSRIVDLLNREYAGRAK